MDSSSAGPDKPKIELPKQPHRSMDSRIVAGVAGGLAEYLDLDPSLTRVIVVAVVIFSGILPGLLLYMACVLILPEKSTEPQ
jgi:phage shock protein C